MTLPNKKQVMQYLFYLITGGIVLFICLNTGEAKKLVSYAIKVLSPFIYGFCIAFIVNLISKHFDSMFKRLAEKKGKEFKVKKFRLISVILALLILIAFAGLTIGLIIPNFKNTIVSLYKQAPQLWNELIGALDKIKTKEPKFAKYITALENNIDVYYEKANVWIKGNVGKIASSAMSKIKDISNVVVNGGLGLVVAFGILLNKEWLVKEFYAILKKILPPVSYRRAKYVLKLANSKFQIYFKYDVIQAVITGTGTFIVMLVSGMPYKLTIALFITVTQLLPIVGAILGTAVGALLIAAKSPIKALIFVLLCILIQQIVEKLINPHLMGKELDMPGILTFLAIVIGGKQFGLIGLVCSVPFVSLVYDIYKYKIRPKIYDSKKE